MSSASGEGIGPDPSLQKTMAHSPGLFQTFRIVEDTKERLVLQENWLNKLVGVAFLLPFGAVLLWYAWYSHVDKDSAGMWLGLLFGLPIAFIGILLLISAVGNRNRRIVFDASAREVRFSQPPPNERLAIPFADVQDVVTRLEVTESGSRGTPQHRISTLYRVCLVTRGPGGRSPEVEINRAGVAEMADSLVAKIKARCQLPGRR